jgi:hypothetical protein
MRILQSPNALVILANGGTRMPRARRGYAQLAAT